MTTFGPLDEPVDLVNSEYGGGRGLVQLGPDGRILYGGEKLGVITRGGKQVQRVAGATATAVAGELVDPVTGISVVEAQQDGPVLPT